MDITYELYVEQSNEDDDEDEGQQRAEIVAYPDDVLCVDEVHRATSKVEFGRSKVAEPSAKNRPHVMLRMQTETFSYMRSDFYFVYRMM